MKFQLPTNKPDFISDTEKIWKNFFMFRERYFYDFKLCLTEDGWRQYDTEQDASYFGIWVHETERIIVVFAEGDEFISVYSTQEAFVQELKRMEEVYGPVPPFAKAIDVETGIVTEFYDSRPTGM